MIIHCRLWNEAIESIAPPPEVESKVKPRKRMADDKASAPKRAKKGEEGDGFAAAALASAASAADDNEPRTVEAGTGSTVYQIYHRAFECVPLQKSYRRIFSFETPFRPDIYLVDTTRWPYEQLQRS